jgi:hypothetical protein
MEAFLATVDNVYPTNTSFIKKEVDKISIYNGNTKFSDLDARRYGVITYLSETGVETDPAQPFDKNNFTFPIKGETVVIFKIANQTFWMPYTNTPYANYRKDYITKTATNAEDITEVGGNTTAKQHRETVNVGGTTTNAGAGKPSDKKEYNVNEKIKFLNPKEGDTILSGRVGNTIRLSEFFLSSDGKSYPGIFIRNKQNAELDSKPIGELIDEDINKDGTSVYFVSGKTKVPFKETISKTKIGFKEYPSDFSGEQLFINSDRIILSAKAKEFIIYGKGNTGVITDGNYSVDAGKDVYINSDKNIIIHSNKSNQIFLNSENGKIFLGKNEPPGDADASVQKMVLGGELVKIMSEMIDLIVKQKYATAYGPTFLSPYGPLNSISFIALKGKLNTLLSSTNFLSK